MVFVSRAMRIVLCAHSVWRDGGWIRGRRAGGAIENWLSHSRTIIVFLDSTGNRLRSLWVGARSASRRLL
jgi:hypothetical protein